MHTCAWVRLPAAFDRETKVFTAPVYCGKNVKYQNPVHPDSGMRERQYETFCPEHLAIIRERKSELE